MEKVWFTADLHLSHANIIKYCRRPFSDTQEMNEAIIMNWNSVVKPEDSVYILGDVAFARPEDAKRLFSRLMGHIYLVKGNHDKDNIVDAISNRLIWAKDYFELKVEGQKMVLSHYPFMTWNGSHRGSWNLHGHCHGTLPDAPHAFRLDVGVDCHGYSPVSFETIKKLMSRKTFAPVDHHGAD